jgi:hypothetical protein
MRVLNFKALPNWTKDQLRTLLQPRNVTWRLLLDGELANPKTGR